MSIIDKLLVLFDDEEEKTLEEVLSIYNSYSKQVISASLGRIVSKGWIKKADNKYIITSKGRIIITEKLEKIQKIKDKEIYSLCQFIIFHIPEKERINRDIMRNFLISNGYGRLHNTVWIKFNPDKEKLKKVISELKINDKILIFETSFNSKKMNDIISFAKWNTQKIDKKYKSFILQSENYIKQKNKNEIDARCLVYEFAKIVTEDPMLPYKENKKCPREEAYLYYTKIRDFC